MREFIGSVGPKGQITLPAEVRRRLKIKPKDKVTIIVDNDRVTVTPVRSWLEASFQAVPALTPARSLDDMAEVAAEEHARHAAAEGL